MYEPQHLKRWTLPENYYGAIWPDYFGAGVGSGDSHDLERSDFACMLEALSARATR
jgi:hypothetical protein